MRQNIAMIQSQKPKNHQKQEVCRKSEERTHTWGAGDRQYDAENRMTQAWGGNNQWQEYTYNADGQRVSIPNPGLISSRRGAYRVLWAGAALSSMTNVGILVGGMIVNAMLSNPTWETKALREKYDLSRNAA